MPCPDCAPLAARVIELEAELAAARRPRKPGGGRPPARLPRNDERGKLLATIRARMRGPGDLPLSNKDIADKLGFDAARLSPSSALSEADMEKLRGLARQAVALANADDRAPRKKAGKKK